MNILRMGSFFYIFQWVESMQKFIEATELMNAESTTKKAIWAQFWSSHQRFFKYLCIASKVKHACDVARYWNKSFHGTVLSN